MARNKHRGNLPPRKRGNIAPKLGYYFIVTDTEATERNYLLGLRESIPDVFQGKIVIRVVSTDTANLIATCKNMAALQPQYGEPWIVFDRDKVPKFDQLINEAQRVGLNVGWSNPCIETWFSAYFGQMPSVNDSTQCCAQFASLFKKQVGHFYKKADMDIYKQLCTHGDEPKAIMLAREKRAKNLRDGKEKPSEQSPGTTLDILVSEIKSKVR